MGSTVKNELRRSLFFFATVFNLFAKRVNTVAKKEFLQYCVSYMENILMPRLQALPSMSTSVYNLHLKG